MINDGETVIYREYMINDGETVIYRGEYMSTHEHTHIDAEGNVIVHSHAHSHTHTHDPKEIKKIINRISKTIGHLQSVKEMLERGEDCAEVLIQLSAVRSEVNNAGKVLLQEHINHCIVEAVADGDQESIDNMNRAIQMFMK